MQRMMTRNKNEGEDLETGLQRVWQQATHVQQYLPEGAVLMDWTFGWMQGCGGTNKNIRVGPSFSLLQLVMNFAFIRVRRGMKEQVYQKQSEIPKYL